MISAKLFSERPLILDIDDEELARQLTLVEHAHFGRIQVFTNVYEKYNFLVN